MALRVGEQFLGDIKDSCNGVEDFIRNCFLESYIFRPKHEEGDIITISSPGLEFIEGGAYVDEMRESFDFSRPLACSRDPMGLEPVM